MLAMMAVIVDYLECVFHFLYSTGRPPNVARPGVTYPPYSPSRRAWVQ